ncbi:MAG TPA: hypothetical protein VFP42_12945 [Acidimicrobiia bacterium]|nr:hypothetical protein [Acidimicrobiia bacterium]
MFVHYYTHVPVSMEDVEARLDDVRGHLEDMADVAYRDGEDLYARVGPTHVGYAKRVRLDIGVPELRRAGLVYPLTWSASGAKALFPKLSANLVLSHVGRERTKLTLEGTYEPPLGPVGRAVDRILLKKVAEATVQDWVDRIAEAVTTTDEVV